MPTTLVFDISRFKEIQPPKDNNEPYPTITRSYNAEPQRADKFYGQTMEDPKDNHNFGVTAEYGFILRHRVAPRCFLGLISSSETNTHELIKLMQTIVKNEPKNALPIYKTIKDENIAYNKYFHKDIRDITLEEYEDFCRNQAKRKDYELVWPMHMSHEEVKKLVEEREKSK